MANYKEFVVDEFDVSSEEEEVLDNVVVTKLKKGREHDPDYIVEKGDTIKIHYTMRYIDLTAEEKIKGKKNWKIVDDTRNRKEAFEFVVGNGEVVRGLDEGVIGLCLHEKAEISVYYDVEVCQINDSGSGIGELEQEEDELDAILAGGLPEGEKLIASSSESEDD
eukprot:g7884.t1